MNGLGFQEKSFSFAKNITELAREVAHGDAIMQRLADRVFCCGTGIGVHIEEAQEAPSKAEMLETYIAARKNSRETLYWLKLIKEHQKDNPKIDELMNEAAHFIGLLSAVIKKLKH